jgi:DnaJ family protein C protein 2
MKVTPWTAMEQQLLEQALKTYPASTPERWERIAECLPTRSKKDCMRRYKVHNIAYNTMGQDPVL